MLGRGAGAAENWHYDVSASKRELALASGAKPVPWRALPQVIDARITADLCMEMLPGAGPMMTACRKATAHNDGVAVLGEAVVTVQGVRLLFSSWPRQQEALRALRRLGYQVIEDGDRGLLVIGWNAELLAARVARLERAVRELERDTTTSAEHALARFRALTDKDGLEDDAAAERVVAECGRAAVERPGARHVHVAAEVDEGDRRRARGEMRQLLNRAAAGEAALTWLVRATEGIARSVVELFREYRHVHGHDKESAAVQTLVETREGVQGAYGPAGSELELRDSQQSES